MMLAISALQHLADSSFELENLERHALDFRVALRRREVTASDQGCQLPTVQFGDEHAFEAAEERPQVSRKWIQVAEMGMGHVETAFATALNCFANRSKGRAPTQDEQLPFVVPEFDLLFRHEVGDA